MDGSLHGVRSNGPLTTKTPSHKSTFAHNCNSYNSVLSVLGAIEGTWCAQLIDGRLSGNPGSSKATRAAQAETEEAILGSHLLRPYTAL